MTSRRNSCDFPGCELEIVGIGYSRCLLHVNVMVSSAWPGEKEEVSEE